MENVIWFLTTIFFAASLVLFIAYYLIPIQNEKNRKKYEAMAESRAKEEADRYLAETPTFNRQFDYDDFNETEIGATSL